MMAPEMTKPMSEINNKAISVLNKALGAIDTIRFLEQFDGGGHGNYTEEKYTKGTPFDKMTDEELRKLFNL